MSVHSKTIKIVMSLAFLINFILVSAIFNLYSVTDKHSTLSINSTAMESTENFHNKCVMHQRGNHMHYLESTPYCKVSVESDMIQR